MIGLQGTVLGLKLIHLLFLSKLPMLKLLFTVGSSSMYSHVHVLVYSIGLLLGFKYMYRLLVYTYSATKTCDT